MSAYGYGLPAQSVQVGGIVVDPLQIVGPQGAVPTRGAHIEVVNMTQVQRVTPTWAIVLAIIGAFFFLLGLLFLLVKEERVTGFYEVRVISNGQMLSAPVYVDQASAAFVWADLQSRLSAARMIVSQAP